MLIEVKSLSLDELAAPTLRGRTLDICDRERDIQLTQVTLGALLHLH